MDQAHLDDIISDAELGPYDGAVASAGPLGEAEEPNIGPFNGLQQWSVDDLWIAEATSVPTSLLPLVVPPWYGFRNSVVPDGYLTWSDAPMPQALVIFDIESWVTIGDEIPTLSGLDKGVLEGYGVENGPQVDPLGLVDDEFQSPFYEVEIPSHMYIPGGNNWHSWSPSFPPLALGDGPYDYWWDLTLDSIIADTTEVPIDTQDVEVYSDNHGIAAVTIDALEQTGTVRITATAEYPYAPKKGKYGPRTSEEITVMWGAIELNPHFQADKTEVEVGETVTFTNLTTMGTLPYRIAGWDFDADDTIDLTYSLALGDVPMADAAWAYDTPGVKTVRLWMTDTAWETRYEETPDYITVSGVALIKGDFDGDGDIEFDDFVAFAAAYSSVLGDANYDVIGDFDSDGDIEFDDFVAFAAVYGYGT